MLAHAVLRSSCELEPGSEPAMGVAFGWEDTTRETCRDEDLSIVIISAKPSMHYEELQAPP